MEPIAPHIDAAAMAAYNAYGHHADWESHNGAPMPVWAELPDATRAHWHAAVTHLLTEVTDARQAIQQAQTDAAQIVAAGLFRQDAKCLVWSNAHGGWWRKGALGYTPDVTQAVRFTVAEAADIVMKAGAQALDPNVKALPEVGVLAPEERWDVGPQIPDGAVRLDLVHQVTGLAGPRYLPFSLDPDQIIQRMSLQLYGQDVVGIPFTVHGDGPLHTVCRREDEDEENPDKVDQVGTWSGTEQVPPPAGEPLPTRVPATTHEE